jgi:ABC-type molybdate transport system substrate-binding protein
MTVLKRWLAAAFIAVAGFFGVAQASDVREIQSVTVLADSRLAVPLSELASRYTRENMVTVSAAFGGSEEQKKRIEDGEAADLFITADAELIQQLKVKGLVDVYSIGRVASHKDVHYTAAVVASENMTSARCFLEFLKTPEAEEILRSNDLSVPKAAVTPPSPLSGALNCAHP